MLRTWLSRILATFLIVTISGGGSGLPVFDALIYHSGAQSTDDWRSHFESSSGCHADGCAIKSTAQHARYAPGIGAPRELAPNVGPASVPLTLPALLSRAPLGQPLSRAPPFLG